MSTTKEKTSSPPQTEEENNEIIQNNQINTENENNQYEIYENNENNNNDDKKDFYPQLEENSLVNNNTSNSNNTKKSEYEVDELFKKPNYIFCPDCKKNYFIRLQSFKYMQIECNCRFVRNCKVLQFIEKYSSKDLSKIGCQIHKKNNEIKKYVKYCKDCKENLCEECLKEIAEYNNDTGKQTTHETHNLIDLLNMKTKIEKVEKQLESFGRNFSNDKYSIKLLLLNLFKHYDESPNYYAYLTIIKANTFLDNLVPIQDEELESEEFIKINYIQELRQKINDSKKIYKIEIDGKKKENISEILDNLDIFENKEFNELKKLQMNDIKKLKDIKGLSNCSFPNLKKLIIGCTDITNDCINEIRKLELPKIKFISFFGDKITSPEIFSSIEKFKTLEKFYIGANPIDINELPNKNIIYNFPPSLIELGISNNITKETNHFITDNLNLENIKLLYVSGNGITSLKQFEKVKFKQLEEFWIRGNINKGVLNSIEDFKYLQGKENIKKIVPKQNGIKNIEKLVDIIHLFPNLKLFNIEDNGIEKERMEKVVKKIKEIKGFKSLEFKY